MAYEDFTGSLDAPAGGYTEFTGVLDGAPAARREVPDATVGSVARDIAAGVLQIGPTAVKGVTDIARLATGGRVGKDTSEAIERGMAAIRDTVGSERAAAQRENFQRDMADDSVGIGKALMRNKGALADQLLPTVGSMFLPVGVAGVAGKAATATKAAVALEAAELAARVAAVQKAAGIGATAAQNSASTFAELVDKGVPMRDAYVGAGITVPFSVVAGALTGGGAEVAAARALTGAGGAKLGARQLAKAAGQEGAQEMGEELGQVAGEAVATGETPSAVSAGKQLAVAGTLGAVMGGGVDVATQVGQRGQPGTAPTSEKAPASTPVQEAPAQAALQSADTPVSAMEEITRLESVQDAQQSAQQPGGTPQSMDGATASTRLAELEVIDSTTGLNPVQQQERAALAQRVEQDAALEAELEAVGELPQDLAAGPAPAERAQAQAFGPAAVQAKTWPQFVLERGEKIGTLRRGTPAWDQLQQEWAAVKTRRAGTNPEGTGATGAPAQEIQNRDRSRPASVVQMQAMAQNPDYLRLGVSRSPESGAPMVFAVGDQADAVQALGRADVAVMSDGQRVPFRYAVMEAADVQPSNFADGGANPLFDAAHPGTVKALNNGRTAGLRAAYERGTADGYRQELAADSAMHGIDPAAIEGMQAPVLVRLYSEKDNQVNMGAKSQSQALGLSATEQAATDAALVDSGVLEVFDSGALDSAANRDFARAFIGKLQEQGQDVAGMVDANGALSPPGVTRLQAALVHKAYGDGDLVESLFGSTDNDIRAIGEALKAVAGEWANMRLAAERGAINAQADVNGNLLQAIRLVQKARRERAALYDAVQQVDMLTGDVPDALTVGMLRLLYSGEYLTRPVGRDRLVEALRDYMGAASATSGSSDMFGEQVGPAAILAAISERAGGQPSTQQSNGTSTNTQQAQAPAPQGGRQPSGGEPAGGRADEAGRGARGPQPDGAGARAAEAGGRGQGQDAQAAQRQQDQQGAEGNGQDRRGEVAGQEARRPEAFIPAPGGGLDYGEITPEMGKAMRRQVGKIRLRQGNEAWGLTHIEKRHGHDTAALGYRSVQDFVSQVAQGFTKIYKGKGAALDVVINNEARGMLIVSMEPSADGDFYDIKTATPIRRDQFKNEKPLWERAGPSTPTAVESSPPFPWSQSGTGSVAASERPGKPMTVGVAPGNAEPVSVPEVSGLGGQADMPMFSRGPAVDQTQTPEFKRWYGDWQNAGNVHRSQQSSAGLRTDAGGADAVPGVQREAGMDSPAGVQPSGPGQVGGDATFTGASGPTGSDGAPLRLYHGTRDDITAFDLNHPNRKDHGWLGAGAYLTSNDFYAEQYAQRKRGEHGPLVMPVYANVRNPYVATQAEKDHIKVGGPRASQAFTEYVKALGHDGVVLDLGEGGIELVAFDPAQVKSAMGNNGDFDPANPDIRFRRRDGEEAGADFDMAGFLGAMDQGRDVAAQAVQRVRATADAIRAGWSNGPEVVVAFDMHDPAIPRAARRADRAQRSGGAAGDPEGIYHNGKVYLLASRLATGQDAARVLFHEALGHHGLRGLYGDALDSILAQIVGARPREVRLKAESYGLDFKRPDHRLQAAEEVLAEMAQARPELGFVRRAVAAVRNWLRQHVPGFAGMRVSDDEIVRDYILPARGWVERGALAAASAPAARLAFSLDSDAGRRALQELAELDDLFTFPKSTQTDLAAIAQEHDPEIALSKPVSVAGRQEYTLTMSGGKKATLSVRQPSPYGEQVYDMLYTADGMEAVTGRPGVNPEDVPPTPDVWLDVSGLEQGDSGAMAYSIASTFAHNTGSIFIGDPHGLSKTALRRRLEQMISSALKFGTTRHLAPHPDQVRGGHGVPGLRWVYGDDVGNVERMIAASLAAMDNAFPTSSLIEYDADHGTFRRASTGDRLSRQRLADVVGRSLRASRGMDGSGPAKAEAGWRTVARAAVWRALLREQGGQDQGNSRNRGSLLGELAERHSQVLRDSDPENRVFYSRGPVAGTATPAQSKGLLTRLQERVSDLTGARSVDDALYAWQDKFIDLKRIQARIKALNGVVSETNDAYRGEELYHKRVAKRTANFERDEVAPLVRAMKAAEVGKEELEQFLHARHAPEANRVLAERNPSQAQIDAERARADKQVNNLRLQLQRAQAQGAAAVPVQKALAQALLEKERWDSAQAFQGAEDERLSLSGMSDAQAQAIMGALPPERRQQLDALAARVDRINAGTLKVLEDYGLMERATLQAWRNTYQHYVPLHRDEAHPDSKAHPIGQGFSTKGEAGKRRTGSNEKVTNILSHVLMQREAALTRGEKNNVVKRLYLLAAQNPDAELWTLDLPRKKAVDPDTGLVRTMVDQSAKLRDNVVTVRIGGHDKHIVFNPRNDRAVRLAQAMKNLDAMELDRFTRTMGKLTRWFAAVNTQYNPVFGAVNLIRDTQGMLLQLSTTPLAGKQAEVLRNVGANLRAIYGDLRAQRKGAGPGQGAWARLFEQMQLDGGTTGYRDLYATPEDRAKALEKELKKLDHGNARAAAQGLVDWLSDFNEAMENTTRLAVYKAALDQGLSRQEAASIAKNITVNFNRKGRNTAVAGSWFAFLNAAIQGNKRMVETLAGPAGRRVMIGGVVLGMFSAAAGMAMMGGGDGADDEWKKIPEFVKERSLVIPLGRQDYVTIPMPLGFHVFPNIGRKMVEFATHDDPVKSRAGYLADMALIALNAYNPLGGADNLMQMATPTPFDPVVAVATNKDWTGRAIEREKRSESDPTPGHARAKDAASQPARWVARGINAATGGNEWREGAWSPTPDAIDYLFGQLTGGVGRELVKAGKMTAAAVTGEELAAHQVIFAGRFYGNTRGTAGQSQAYYDNLKRINGDMAEAKGRVERGEEADAVLQDVPLARLNGAASVVDKRVSDLVKMRRRVQASDDPNKRELVKEINGEIEASMHRLNQASVEVLGQVRR